MRKTLALVVCLVLVMSGMFIGGTVLAEDNVVTVMTVWSGQEAEAFMKVAEAFEAKTGIKVQHEGTRDLPTLLTTRVEAGNPPDIAALTGMGLMKQHAEEGNLIDLTNVLDMEQLRNDYDQKWLDLATYKGGMYGLYISADMKSLVWYNPKAFAAAGYEIPTNWEELNSLMKTMVDNGDIPWSIGLESGAASGWPGTDWIEDIMLRTAGPEVYDQWVNHDIPWTDPRVKRAFAIFGRIARGFSWGGPTAVLSTNFGDAADPLFTDPPQAYMHRQASFIVSFIQNNNPGLTPGEDFNFFPFPRIEAEYGVPALGAADMISMLNDTPEARKFMQFLASPEAQEIWIGALGKLGVNNRIDPAVYPNELTKKMAEALNNAPIFRFDGSDSMPSQVGSGAFWQGVLDYVSGQDLDAVLETIEAVADDAYTTGEATD